MSKTFFLLFFLLFTGNAQKTRSVLVKEISSTVKEINSFLKDLQTNFEQKFHHFQLLLDQKEQEQEKKLKKMMNVLTIVHEHSKDIKDTFQKELLDADSPLKEIEKLLKEQLSILFRDLKIHFKSSTQDFQAQLDSISSQVLLIKDDLDKVSFNKHVPYECPSPPVTNFSALLEKQTQTILDAIQKQQQQQVPKDVPKESKPKPIEPVPLGRALKSCSSVPSTISSRNCFELLKEGGATCNGIYVIVLGVRAHRIYCDMDNGGWSVFMRRGHFGNKKRVAFNQDWNSYRDGFGELEQEFWLGNQMIHQLCKQTPQQMRVDLETENGHLIYFHFDNFSLGSEEEGFPLYVSSASFSDLLNHNGTKFSTQDRNLSGNRKNCALEFEAGWWFDQVRCFWVFLTGERGEWAGERVKRVEMKIRPKL